MRRFKFLAQSFITKKYLIIFLDEVLDFLDYNGLHPQRKEGHARSVPGELKLIY